MAEFTVENYSGGKKQTRRTRSLKEAHSFASETPESSVSMLSGRGWVLRTAVYSPKHPLPAFDDFKKWARKVKVKTNPRRKKASPAQLAARAKFAAMVRTRGAKGRAGRIAKARVKRAAKKRASNPVGEFQIAALKGSKVLYLSGIALTNNRAAASTTGKLETARKIARQVRAAGAALGISKVAVVTLHDSAADIARFLAGKR